jgi:hypothetical protein
MNSDFGDENWLTPQDRKAAIFSETNLKVIASEPRYKHDHRV